MKEVMVAYTWNFITRRIFDDGEEEAEASKQAGLLDALVNDGFRPVFTGLFARKTARDTSSTIR